MNVTVFGGAGFLGSHVADALTDRGYKVKIFDRKKSLYLKKNQQMIEGDILDAEAVRKAVADADYVYNFIAIADLDEANLDPMQTAKINIVGNINILEAIKKTKVKRFIFSSSIYVYSDAGSFYRSSKQACELFIENYQKAFGLDYTVLRYGSLYGPRSNEQNWVYRILKQALFEKKIIREGNGEEIREYIHVYDAARLSVDILEEEFRNRHIIITGNERMRIKDLMTMIQEILKGDVELQFLPTKINEHYEITPYVFKPQLAFKLHASEFVDMGQGMIEILNDIHKDSSANPMNSSRG